MFRFHAQQRLRELRGGQRPASGHDFIELGRQLYEHALARLGSRAAPGGPRRRTARTARTAQPR